MAGRYFSRWVSESGFRGTGIAGDDGVTLLEIIIALAVTLIISIGLSAPNARSEQRALYNACLQLQADIREAQNRAVLEGKDYSVFLYNSENYYKMGKSAAIASMIDRTVYLDDGISYYENTKSGRITFRSSGTPSYLGTITMSKGRYTQSITVTVSGGRALIGPME